MASGLPVVATRAGGVAEILRSGETGQLADDEHTMTKALLELIKNPDLRKRMGANARLYVEKNHSLQQMALGLGDIYEAALS
jgi:spore coat protein SA